MKKVVFLLIFVVMIVSCGGGNGGNTSDTVAPNWENGLIESKNISYTSLDLNWSGDTDNVAVTYYKLFKDDVLFNENILTKEISLTDLTENTTYKFKVEACDKENNCSINGPEINVTTLKEDKPPYFTEENKIEIIRTGIYGFKIKWNEAKDDVGIKEYKIYLNDDLYKTINSTEIEIANLDIDTNYYVKIEAVDTSEKKSTNQLEKTIKTNSEVGDILDNVSNLNLSAIPTFKESVDFIYSGINPVQINLDETIIDENRIAVIHGFVFDENGNGLKDVEITINNHPEYGFTQTRENGEFDIVVNGGGAFVINYKKSDLIPVQRRVVTSYKNYYSADDIVMIPFDNTVTRINFSNSEEVQLVNGSLVEDSDGQRKAMLIINPQTRAFVINPDGSEETLNAGNVRITEFTQGENGLLKMPGELPPSSGYTYAAELSIDEVNQADGKQVRFNQPLYFYMNNFLNINTGTKVPTGYYDKNKGTWIASNDGIVLKITEINNGVAYFDINGDNITDDIFDETNELYKSYNFTIDEVEAIGQNYQIGDVLWRIPIIHFTPWDHNFPYTCAGGVCYRPNGINPFPKNGKACTTTACIIDIQTQLLGENVNIAGTNIDLNYKSNRHSGYKNYYELDIPATPENIDDIRESFNGSIVIIEVAGNKIKKEFEPLPNQVYNFKWDGKDKYKRKVQGTVKAVVKVGYRYKGVYTNPSENANSFAQYGEGEISIDRTRKEIILWQTYYGNLGIIDFKELKFGGWIPSVYHFYDSVKKIIYYGDGKEENSENLISSYVTKFGGYGTETQNNSEILNSQIYANNITTDAEGNIYYADSLHHVVRKINKEGKVFTIAGTYDQSGFSGDGSLAVNAKLNNPYGVEVDDENNIYIADTRNQRIRKIDTNGIITTIAGNGEENYTGDNFYAKSALFDEPNGIVYNNGIFYIADSKHSKIRKIDTNGIITTLNITDLNLPNNIKMFNNELYIVDTNNHCIKKIQNDSVTVVAGICGQSGYTGDNGLSTQAKLYRPRDVAFKEDGSFYISDTDNNVIRYVQNETITTIVSGLNSPSGMIYKNNNLYFSDTDNNQVKKIDESNNITIIAGNGSSGFSGDNEIAVNAKLKKPNGLIFDNLNNLYIADSSNKRIRKVDTNGIITTIAGDGTNNVLNTVNYLTTDENNNLYATTMNNIVYKINLQTNLITQFAGVNNVNFDGDGLNEINAAMSPYKMFISKDKSIYFTDYSKSRIRKISPDGLIQTFAGTNSSGFSGDNGLANKAKLNKPTDITGDEQGNIYFADAANYRIRKVDTSGIMSTIIGNGTYDFLNTKLNPLNSPVNFLTTIFATNDYLYFGEGSADSGTHHGRTSGRIFKYNLNTNSTEVVIGGCGKETKAEFDDFYDNHRQEYYKCEQTEEGLANEVFMNITSLMVNNENEIYFIKDQTKINKVSQYKPVENKNGSYFVYSENGSELFVFDANGRHLQTLDALTNKVLLTFEYDENKLLSSITDLYENKMTIERDSEGNISKITAPYGQQTTFELNADKYLTKLTLEGNEVYKFDYYTNEQNGLLKSITNPKEVVKKYFYNEKGLFVKEEDGLNHKITFEKTGNNNNNTVTMKSEMGREKKYQTIFDAEGNYKSIVTFENGLSTNYTMSNNKSEEIIYPDGTKVTTEKKTTKLLKNTSPYTSKLKAVLPSGKEITIENEIIETFTNERDVTTLEKIVSKSKTNGAKEISKEYDKLLNKLTFKSPMGKEGFSYFNEKDLLIKSEISGVLPVNYEYDDKGRTTRISQGERFVEMRYNDKGQLSEVENIDGEIVKYFYNEKGYLIKTILPNNHEINQNYDENGNIKEIKLPEEKNHSFVYDLVDRLKNYIEPQTANAGNITTYDYNADNQLISIEQPENNLINYNYDSSSGVLDSIVYPDTTINYVYNSVTGKVETISKGNETLAYTYDGGLLLSEESAGNINGLIEYNYDNDLRINEVKVNDISINYSFNDDNELLSVNDLVVTNDETTGFMKETNIDNVKEKYEYNQFGEVKKYEVFYSNNLIYSESYVYNVKGFIEVKTVVDGSETNTFNYVYDKIGQLTEVKKNNSAIETYSYDSNGNRLNNNAQYDSQDRLISNSSTTFGYTERGTLLTRTENNQTTSYNYDLMGNLLSVTLPNSTNIEYITDARNRRIAKKVNGTVVQKFLYLNQLEPIAELDANDNIVSLFVYGTRSNTPDYIVKNNVKYKVVTNQLGSVVKIINTTNGTVEQAIEYDSFGNILSDTNPNFQPFTLAGGIYDNDTQLTRFGARDYDSETGRWTTKDPIKFDGGRNFYSYCNGDPVNRIDVNGLMDIDPMTGTDYNAISGNWKQYLAGVLMAAIFINAPVIFTYQNLLISYVFGEAVNLGLGNEPLIVYFLKEDEPFVPACYTGAIDTNNELNFKGPTNGSKYSGSLESQFNSFKEQQRQDKLLNHMLGSNNSVLSGGYEATKSQDF